MVIRSIMICIFSVLLMSFSAQAGVRLFEWTSDSTLAPLVLAVRDGETPQAAAKRYLLALEKNPDMMEIFAGRSPFLTNSQFKELNDADRTERALLMANLAKDYTVDSLRVSNFMELLEKSGHRSLILPIAAGIHLSLTEAQDFYKLVSEKFPFLVALGGEDVDPAKYGKENLHSRNTNPTRDRFEIQMIKTYVAAEKGFLLGVCRGAQISSVALGYKLHQHVPVHIGTKVSHADHWHDISVFKTQHNLLARLSRDGKMMVNSLHHQSIQFHENGPLQMAARSGDGVTEALEFKNGRGLLLQFHPELMGNELGREIITQVLSQKVRVQAPSCRSIF